MSILDRINASFGLDPAALREEIEQLRQRLESQEHAASQRQQLLQSVVDAAPAAIVLLDQMGTIVFANRCSMRCPNRSDSTGTGGSHSRSRPRRSHASDPSCFFVTSKSQARAAALPSSQ